MRTSPRNGLDLGQRTIRSRDSIGEPGGYFVF
jgi:hypothetical protein